MESILKSTQVPILTSSQIAQKLKRMAYEIYEQNSAEKEIVFIGIEEGGLIVAKNLQAILNQISPVKSILLPLKMNKKSPLENVVRLDMDLNQRSIVLVDDVANSGKTLIFALKFILEDVPSKIKIAVLVDRKHKDYPIVPDIIGHSVSTTLQDSIVVNYEGDELTAAFLE